MALLRWHSSHNLGNSFYTEASHTNFLTPRKTLPTTTRFRATHAGLRRRRRHYSFALFALGARLVRRYPLLTEPVSNLLDRMRHGSGAIPIATLTIYGVGKGVLFQNVS